MSENDHRKVPFSASLFASQNVKVYLFQEALLSYTNLKIKFTCMGLLVWSPQLRFYTLSNSLLVLMCCLPIHVESSVSDTSLSKENLQVITEIVFWTRLCKLILCSTWCPALKWTLNWIPYYHLSRV